MRACQPARDGYVERDGVRVFWERHGQGEPTFLLPPTYEIVHSRSWKCQSPYQASHGQVVTFDPRCNGRSDRPRDYAAYTRPEVIDAAIAVEVGRPVDYRPVETDRATRAAALLGALL